MEYYGNKFEFYEKKLKSLAGDIEFLIKEVLEDMRTSTPESTLFYPEEGEKFFYIKQCNNRCGYYINESIKLMSDSDYEYPKIRTEEQAKLIAWARGEADKWRAMGVEPCWGEIRYFFIHTKGEVHFSREIPTQVKYEALFPSEKAAKKALKEFGGIEHLNKVRRGLWGIE